MQLTVGRWRGAESFYVLIEAAATCLSQDRRGRYIITMPAKSGNKRKRAAFGPRLRDIIDYREISNGPSRFWPPLWCSHSYEFLAYQVKVKCWPGPLAFFILLPLFACWALHEYGLYQEQIWSSVSISVDSTRICSRKCCSREVRSLCCGRCVRVAGVGVE
jgi:hypothetical protein